MLARRRWSSLLVASLVVGCGGPAEEDEGTVDVITASAATREELGVATWHARTRADARSTIEGHAEGGATLMTYIADSERAGDVKHVTLTLEKGGAAPVVLRLTEKSAANGGGRSLENGFATPKNRRGLELLAADLEAHAKKGTSLGAKARPQTLSPRTPLAETPVTLTCREATLLCNDAQITVGKSCPLVVPGDQKDNQKTSEVGGASQECIDSMQQATTRCSESKASCSPPTSGSEAK